MALHERLGEIFRAFELRGFLARPENLQTTRAEQIDDACGERPFRPNQREGDLFFLNEIGECGRIGDVDVAQTLVLDELDPRRLRELPCERMFATAGTDDE
jgi:hypothetical protein